MVDPRHAGSLHALGGALSGACEFSNLTLPEPPPPEPFSLLAQWLADAAHQRTQPNPNAFCLATVDPDGRPSARIVLCRGLDQTLGSLSFFTNYLSRKGRAIDHLGYASACFHWDHLDRQARVEGPVVRAPQAESDAYFASRPVMSRVAAWASRQSEPLTDRAALLAAHDRAAERFGVPADAPRTAKGDIDPALAARISVPRPPHWGGFRLIADRVELWLGHSARLHDRVLWTRALSPSSADAPPAPAGPWSATRLQP